MSTQPLDDIGTEILAAILDQAAKHPDPDLIARGIGAAILGLGVMSPQGNAVIEQVCGILASRGYLPGTAQDAGESARARGARLQRALGTAPTNPPRGGSSGSKH